MKKTWKISISVLLLLSMGLLFFGCAPATTTPPASGDKPLTKIVLSEVTHSVFYAPQYAAMELGFFKEQGIELDLINGGGADKVMSALLSDGVNIGLAGPEAAIYVYNEGKEDYIEIFGQLTKRDGSFLVGRNPDPNFKWENLKGKYVIGGRKGGVPQMTFEYVLKKNGLQPATDMNMDTGIAFNLIAGAFSGGTGDYVTLFEPTASVLEKEGKGYVLTSIGQESGEIPYTAYFAKKSYIAKNPDIIKAFNAAVQKGQEWISTATPAEIAKTVSPHFVDTDLAILEAVAKRYQEIDAWNKTPFMTEESFTRLQDVMEASGELSARAPYEKLFNANFSK